MLTRRGLGLLAALLLLHCSDHQGESRDPSKHGPATASTPPPVTASAPPNTTPPNTAADAEAVVPPTHPVDALPAAPEATAGVSCAPKVDPKRVLFIGNSFTRTYDVPGLFRRLALAGGFSPSVEVRAVPGQSLNFHRTDRAAAGAPARLRDPWDVVVLQEYSTRPTDYFGNAKKFEDDLVWFHDKITEVNPQARVVLYETFARHPDHPFYPHTFANPKEMQRQLTFWHHQAAEQTVPARAKSPSRMEIAHVGDAWAQLLSESDAPRLHGGDNYHPNPTGAYFAALVIFGSIYHSSTAGLPAIHVGLPLAQRLQAAADAINHQTALTPSVACPAPLEANDSIRIDFGALKAAGWSSVQKPARVEAGPLVTAKGRTTTAFVTTSGFLDAQLGGNADPTLGYPPEVSRDSFWVGSSQSHARAKLLNAEVVLYGLADANYQLTLFASRSGLDTGGKNRLTRYSLGEQRFDLEVANNRSNVVTFKARPEGGRISLGVTVSPEGNARYAYLGSVVVERVD